MSGRRLSNCDPALRAGWHPVARSGEVGETPHGVQLLGQDWVLVRLPEPDGSSTLSAFIDECPHRLAPLSLGWVDGNTLRCGYHGWCFAADGHCTEVPAIGTDRVPARAAVTVPGGLCEHQGLVFLAPDVPITEILDVPESEDPSFVHGTLEPARAAVGAGLMIDNFLDMAHFPFLHAATIGTSEATVVPDVDVERDAFGMTVRSRHRFPNHEDPGVDAGIRPLIQERVLTYSYRAPFLASLRIDYVEAGGTNVVTLFVQPETAETCRLYATIHRNDLGDDVDRMPSLVAYEAKILDEDLRLQERFRDRRLPLELTDEVHTRADKATIELRRILADLVDSVAAPDSVDRP